MEKNILSQISKSKWPMRVFGILLVIILIYMLFFFNTSPANNTNNSNNKDAVLNNAVDYLNTMTGGGVTLIDSTDIGSLYEITISYQGQQIPVYVTKDGEYFVPEIVPINQQPQQQTQQQPQQTQRVNLDDSEIEGAPYLGDENAPITIIEFSDYSCPFCGRHYLQTKPLIKSNYIDNGLVKYVWMDFVGVGTSTPHEATLCVRELVGDDSYWNMNGLILENQEQVRSNPGILSELAVQSGASQDAFEECLSSGKYQSQILESTQLGQSLGIRGTPGFLIGNQENGYELVSGAQSFNVFQQTIERELNN